MKGKKILSGFIALGMAVTAFSGITPVANAAAETVTFFPQGKSQITLNADTKDYMEGEEKAASFADGKITFSKDITLTANGVSGTYGTCISATSSTAKTLTIEIPLGVTVTMDNSNASDSWRTALNSTSTGDLTITGGGTLVIDGKGATGYGLTPYGKAITIDNTTVKTTGTSYGVGYYSGGSLTVINGGVLEATGGTKAFESASVTAEGAAVMVGENADSASEGVITDIASNKYAKITMPKTDMPTDAPTDAPTGAPTETPTEVPTEAPTEPPKTSTNGPESGVYLCRTKLVPGNFMRDDYSIYSEGEPVVGEEGCVAHFDDKGVLTLGGALTVNEAREGTFWGAIGGVKGKADFVINLLPNSNITLNSKGYSGIYGNYEPIKIQGKGQITINTSDASNGGILVYGKDDAVPTGVTITDGAKVTINGTKGISLTGGADGDISVTNGAVLTVETTSNALSKAPVIEEGSTVMVGESADTASEWDGTTSLTTYKYVQIKTAGAEEEPTPTPDLPTPSPTTDPNPVDTPDPNSPYSAYMGIQTSVEGEADWYSDKHYLMPDGKHYNEKTNQAEGFIKGTEVMYYDKANGVIEFNKDITLYGLSDKLSSYYGSAIVPELEKNFTIRLNNNANVTIDATNRDEYAYLYGLYSTGHLVIEGKGTLRIKSNNGKSDNAALCVFSGNTEELRASLTIKDDVLLVLENTDENGYGMNVYGSTPGIGNITVQGNAVIEMTGGKSAVNKVPVVQGKQKIFVGADKNSASEWNKTTDISTYKYVRISESSVVPTDPPATPTPEPTPELVSALPKSGLVFYDDYENVPAYDWNEANIATMRKRNGGNYNSVFRMQIDTAEGHGKVFKMPTNISDAVGFYYNNKDLFDLDKDEDINSGTFIISNDIFIPSDIEFVGTDALNAFMMTYSANGWKDMTGTKEYAYLYEIRVESGASNGMVVFGDGSNPNNMPAKSSLNTKNIDFDKWYKLETVIDYESGAVSYYVDGEWITSTNVLPTDIKKYFSMSYISFQRGGKSTTSAKPVTFLFDNFRLEYDSDILGADIVSNGNNYVDVKFAHPIDTSAGVSVSVAPLDGAGAPLAMTGYTNLSADTVRFNFADNTIESSKAYELVFDKAVGAAYGNGIIGAGEGLIFTADADKQVTKLIDMDFENLDINEGNSADFDDFSLTHQNADNSTFEDDKSNTYKYVSSSNGVLEYDHYLDIAGQERNGLKFPFKDSEGNLVTVSKGIINVEFDAGIRGDASRTRAVFGLNDPEKNDSEWTSATLFGVITPYSGNRMSFTKPKAENRNRLTVDSSIDDTVALNTTGDMHHYKYVIDLDNNSYKIYYDNSLLEEIDYIPGAATDNSFDAFVMSAVHAKGGVTDKGQTFLMLDNLTVTAEVLKPAVRKVSFVKYDNTEKPYSKIVSAGTQKIKLAFTKDMASDIADYITVSGMTSEDYTVSYADKTAVISLKKCLSPSTAYKVTVGAEAKDADNNAIGTNIVYSFNSDAGEIAYMKPVVKVNGEAVSNIGTLTDTDRVTAEVTVVNTTNQTAECWVTIAGYSNDKYLTSIKPMSKTANKSEISVVTLEGDISQLKDADEIGVFVFDSLENIRPLTECTKIRK